MRISDWSSDVCSSDLDVHDADPADHEADRRDRGDDAGEQIGGTRQRLGNLLGIDDPEIVLLARLQPAALAQQRSEEHTSELQSLMRISYAVFCLKKKT